MRAGHSLGNEYANGVKQCSLDLSGQPVSDDPDHGTCTLDTPPVAQVACDEWYSVSCLRWRVQTEMRSVAWAQHS